MLKLKVKILTFKRLKKTLASGAGISANGGGLLPVNEPPLGAKRCNNHGELMRNLASAIKECRKSHGTIIIWREV